MIYHTKSTLSSYCLKIADATPPTDDDRIIKTTEVDTTPIVKVIGRDGYCTTSKITPEKKRKTVRARATTRRSILIKDDDGHNQTTTMINNKAYTLPLSF